MIQSAQNSTTSFAGNFRKFLVAPVAGIVPGAAAAQRVEPCDWQAAARNLVEPWETNRRSFANGEVRLARLDMIEPAAGVSCIFALSPPDGALGARQCRIIGRGGRLQ